MVRVLPDTDILSEYLKGHDKAVAARAAEYAREHGRFTFTSVTVHEIVFGLEFKRASGQLQKALAWLNQNEQITPTADDYLEAALLKAAARKQGAIVELPDCLIAAVAIRLGMPLVTGNTNDFQSIQKTGAKLVIDNWRVRHS
jgi:tRNA(fMet)-specific endonuclease VapC